MRLKAKNRTRPSLYDDDFKFALPALERAAQRARETALRTGTPLVLWEDGQIKLVSPVRNERKQKKRI